MPNRGPWIERQFNFDFPITRSSELIELLRSTPGRVAEVSKLLSPAVLVRRHDDTWSIQENVGHLGDLEEIWAGRLSDYKSAAAELRPADTSNRVTHLADHNSRSIDDLTRDFESKRKALVKRLEALKPQDFERTAYHRRLDVQMRLVDMLYFIAEHDDHHLDRMRWLVEQAG